MNGPSSTSSSSLPLSRLLGHTADALLAVRDGRSLTDVLAACPEAARPGTQALIFHVLRVLGSADLVRRHLAPKAPPPAVDALLTTALALLWPMAAPPYAAHTLVDQAVKAATRMSKASAPFINAVLRRFLRERDAVVALVERDPVGAFNHPLWWMERVQRDWPDDWQRLLNAASQHPPFTLRVNARRGSVSDYAARLALLDIESTIAGPHALTLRRPMPVTALPGFAEGDVSVQDVSAQLAAPLLIGPGLHAGARVLDACAAPGGKTAHLLELADLDVLAVDADASRLVRVNETMRRLSLKATTVAADARNPATWWDGRPFDAILLDAPCTASGIVRRHPDIRWLRRPGDVDALVDTQAALLDALWPLLAPGGRFVFCTCSVFKAEGADRMEAFLQRTCDAVALPAPGHILPLADNADADAAAVTGGDGFFYALLQKAAR